MLEVVAWVGGILWPVELGRDSEAWMCGAATKTAARHPGRGFQGRHAYCFRLEMC